jgi:PAS domain S-box-containing protein
VETAVENIDTTLTRAVQQAADVIMVTDLSGVIRYVNSAFEKASGYSPTEAVGRHVRLLKSGRHAAEFYRNLWSVLSQGQTWRGTFVNRRKDGRLYEDETVISTLRDAAAVAVGYLAVKRDVTVERQNERQLRQLQRMDAIGRLAGGVAHDFNNYLMTIVGHAEMLEGRLSQTDRSCEELAEIKAACDRATGLTRQLLTFGRRQAREPVVVDANRVVFGLEKMLRRLLGEHVRLTLVPSPRPLLVQFQSAQLEQVIMALAIRAAETTPADGAFTVTVSGREVSAANGELDPKAAGTPGWTVIRVTDTTLELDADAQARVFEPFYLSKLQSCETGFALAAAQEMIRQSGGRIAVRSAPAEGTTFTIELPSILPDNASISGRRWEPRPVTGSETVLLAEDETVLRDVMGKVLRRLGYRVLDAPDGATAMERAALHQGRIDVLITDVVMPGMTANELTDRLLGLHPTAKVIYMSGYPDDAIAHHGVWERDAVFLQKPFTPEVLARTVREVCERR